MANMGEILRLLRTSRHMTQQEVADGIGVDQDTISRLENLPQPPKRGNTYRRMVEFLRFNPEHVTPLWSNDLRLEDVEDVIQKLAGIKPTAAPRPIINFTIPRVGNVEATGFGDFTIDLNEVAGLPGAHYPFPSQEPMVLGVKGSSMSGPGGIEDGDDVIFANLLEEELPPETIVVALDKVNGGQTVKIIDSIDAERVVLRPHNPKFQKLVRRREDVVLRRVLVVINNLWRRR